MIFTWDAGPHAILPKYRRYSHCQSATAVGRQKIPTKSHEGWKLRVLSFDGDVDTAVRNICEMNPCATERYTKCKYFSL